MAGWLSEEDLNGFEEDQFMDLLEEPEQPVSVPKDKQTISNIVDLEELSRSTETSSQSRASTSKHLKVSQKSTTIRKQYFKVTKSHPASRDMGKLGEVAWDSDYDSTTPVEPNEEEAPLSALETKEIGNALQEIKARVEMIKGNLTFTKDILSKLIRKKR